MRSIIYITGSPETCYAQRKQYKLRVSARKETHVFRIESCYPLGASPIFAYARSQLIIGKCKQSAFSGLMRFDFDDDDRHGEKLIGARPSVHPFVFA